MTGLHAALTALVAEWRESSANHPACAPDEDCVGCAADEVAALLDLHEPSGQVDHEQAYNDLRAGVEALAEELHSQGWNQGPVYARKARVLLASSAPAPASEEATECQMHGPGSIATPNDDGIYEPGCTCPKPDESDCTCRVYVVDHSDPEPHHPENLDREDDPDCPIHSPATGVTSSDVSSKPGSSLENAGSTDGDLDHRTEDRPVIPIETLLAQVLVDHRLREGPVPIGARCTCGWRPYGLDEHTHRQHLAARLTTALRSEGLVETEWAVINNGQIIHIADATCPADVMRATHGHGTHGPVGVARRTVTRSPWQHLEGGPS